MQDPERDPKERTLIFVQVRIGTSTNTNIILSLFRPRRMQTSWPPICLGRGCQLQAFMETGEDNMLIDAWDVGAESLGHI